MISISICYQYAIMQNFTYDPHSLWPICHWEMNNSTGSCIFLLLQLSFWLLPKSDKRNSIQCQIKFTSQGYFFPRKKGSRGAFGKEEGLWRQIYRFLWTDSCFSLATPGSHSTFGSKAPSELFESKKEVWVIIAEVVQANPSIVKSCLAQRLHKSSLSCHCERNDKWVKGAEMNQSNNGWVSILHNLD